MTDPVLALGLAAFALLLLALPLSFWSVSGAGQGSTVVRLLVATANLALTAQLVLRWWQSGHFPISNLYESLCFLAWACTLTQLLVERTYRSPLVARIVVLLPVPRSPMIITPPMRGSITFNSRASFISS